MVKTVEEHWCVDDVDDLSFAQVVNFLIDSGILIGQMNGGQNPF